MTQFKHHSGLSDKQVEENRLKYGANLLTPPEKESLFHQFIEKFEDPIIRILLIALGLSVGVASYQYFTDIEGLKVFLEPAGIFLAVLLATGVGFIFELSANKKFEILNQVNDDSAVKVIRNGNIKETERKEIVKGDLVLLETGDEIPADGKLLEAISLQVNESALTGEPVIRKSILVEEFRKEATYPTDQVYRGTSVTEGHGLMIVEQVGDKTEYGKVYQGAQIENKIKTPLNEQLDKLGETITTASYIIAGLIVTARLCLYFFDEGLASQSLIAFASYFLNTLMIAVTVIVVAVPEGLPMSVTLSLALSMKRMLQTNNLVRKMHACETMGASTVICTDKTGTLTQNQMKVADSFFPGGYTGQDENLHLIAEGIAVNSTAHLDFSSQEKIKTLGNPTETALLIWLHQQQFDYLKTRETTRIIKQLPFSTERKFMATLIDSTRMNKKILYVKGASEIILNKCTQTQKEGTFIPLNDIRQEIETKLSEFQAQAMRTLALGYKIIDQAEPVTESLLQTGDLVFLGITAISDPVRKEVPLAIHECMQAGIEVKIVTGDTAGTAKEIGKQIGLWKEEDENSDLHITGEAFAALSDETALERVEKLKIISRARPMDKERLVKLLQQRNQVVAVTGDGTNDAPALNAAQVGLSMGDGTSVAKEASAITILDNSFMSITRAVMWGRSLYLNIQRFILFQMTINVAACLIVLIGAFMGTESPLTVTQMLWVNLIMDTFAALALASLPPNESLMNEKPRPRKAYIISRKMAIRILATGLSNVVVLFGFLQYFRHEEIYKLKEFSINSFTENYFNFGSSAHELTPYELSLFFSLFVFLQFWNMFNAKAYHTGETAFSNLFSGSVLKGFTLIALIILAGQILIVTIGGEMFNVVPLSVSDWLILLIGTSPVLIIGEIYRLFKRIK